jgi:hypothetical protein
VTLTVRSRPKKGKKVKTETLGTASFLIPAGETKLVSIKLQGRGRALLRNAHGHLDASLKIAKAAPSPGATETESVRLKQQQAVQKK